ncbi:DUF6443 domain-containing protein [Pedobacter sp. PACM 27299]|uniref:DUF6443 domain-containing protein n=1 Tax=Pedobacter sp. PACM 27299 TaxID=1727164 RepID=UPI000A967198|nr:DUF6443 domain-containing protein [Pedobacter sp. PACM 27299]
MALICTLSTTRLSAQESIFKNVYNGEAVITSAGSITFESGFHVPSGANFRAFITNSPSMNCKWLGSFEIESRNYILSYSPKVEGIKTIEQLRAKSICAVTPTINFIDGLGRSLQTVQIGASPSGKDVVKTFKYDANGREVIKYLPYSDLSGQNGNYKSDAVEINSGVFSFYNSPNNLIIGIVKTPNPYQEIKLENSPLNRMLEEGAPGVDWQLSNGHTTKIEYGFNATDEVILWLENGNSCVGNSFFSENQLFKKTFKDENWVNGKTGTIEEFKDKLDRVILKRLWQNEMNSLSTYYVYDDLNNLRYVIPPGLNLQSFNEGSPAFNNFIYAYSYDSDKKLVRKKIPGKGWEEMVYNKIGQLVLSRDARQFISKNWSFYKYDVMGRRILSGTLTSEDTRESWQERFKSNAQVNIWENRDNDNLCGNGTGYTSISLPLDSERVTYKINQYLNVNYYDDYSFYNNTFKGDTARHTSRTKDLLTGTRNCILDSNLFMLKTHYYDLKGQLVQSQEENHLGGKNLVNFAYNFVGNVTDKNQINTVDGSSIIIASRFEYDQGGRKTGTFVKINDSPEVMLSKLDYNELGQIWKKGLHIKDQGENFLQQTVYEYNERGWIKNNISNEFSTKILYQDGNSPQYNGNISAQHWGSANNYPNKFTYTYDAINRLLKAISTGVSMSEELKYDDMGNISMLNRDDLGQNQYNYTGNRLNNISNGPLETGLYEYDANGNTITDGRNLVNVTYNQLNLPATVKKTGLNVVYTYNSEGVKLQKISNGNIRNYVGGIEYIGTTVDLIHTEEGIARNNSGVFSYEYNLTDHLGNVRYSFRQHHETGLLDRLQSDDYYAFGKRKSSGTFTSTLNKYLYNGKEIQDELDGQYDYGARFYDPVTGRFNTIDRFSEKYYDLSPYQYGANNPIKNIDVNGDSINVVLMQQYDKTNSTNHVSQTLTDLQSQTGLSLSIDAKGQLSYLKDPVSGTPFLNIQMGSGNNLMGVGSAEARNLITSAIDNTTTGYARITSSGSSAPLGGNLMSLNPSQINNFISGVNGVDSRTLGFGMTFMHELTHSGLGGGLTDPSRSAGFGPTGPTVDRMNIIRSELNDKGGNYGQRSSYQAVMTTPGGPAYLPFSPSSLNSLKGGIVPAITDKFIKF